jgi:hypothetical protein
MYSMPAGRFEANLALDRRFLTSGQQRKKTKDMANEQQRPMRYGDLDDDDVRALPGKETAS